MSISEEPKSMKNPRRKTDSLTQEEEWIEASKTDPNAFQFLFNEYYDLIYNFAYRRTLNRALAQDISAVTFMKALENIHRFVCRGIPFSAWLYRIAVNEINLYHRKRKRLIPLTTERALHLVHDNRTDQRILQEEEDEEKIRQFRKIHQAIASLKAIYQDAITLRYFEDKSIREIAEILDLSENTVKTHIHRGLQHLRTLL
jgi:RNA polymerase sigma-70 factor (ECF subfamily)